MVALDGLAVGGGTVRPAEMRIGGGDEGRRVAQRLWCRRHGVDGFVVMRAANSAMPANAAYHSGWCGARRKASRPAATAISCSPSQAMAAEAWASTSASCGLRSRARISCRRAAVVVAGVELRHAEDAVRPMVAIVELHRLGRQLENLLAREVPVVPGKARPLAEMGHGEAEIGAGKSGVPGQRLLKAPPCLGDRAEIRAAQGAPSPQPEVVGAPVFGPPAAHRLELRILDAADQRADDAANT